jgi:hypothetical protein
MLPLKRYLGVIPAVIILMLGLASPALSQDNAVPPPELFAPVGTVLTVQVRDFLSSDKNSSGDLFIGMLQQPLVIDGWVVARPGQTVFGQVVSTNSAGRVKGTSDIALELTEMVLVDGLQMPVRTQLFKDYGGATRKEDGIAIASVTAVGTAIGAAAGGGKGAIIGAGIGAGAATIGVLSTKGKATEIYPESTLTFRLDAPLIVSTVRSRQAFQAVHPDDYKELPELRRPQRRDRDSDDDTYYPGPRRGPVYDPHPRSRIGVIPSIVIVPNIIINSRGRGRGPWGRW